MSDRDFYMTTSGVISGSSSGTFDIVLTGSNTLSSYTNAVYMFEITIVMYASGTHGNTYRGYMYAFKRSGSLNANALVQVFNDGDSGGTLTVTRSVLGPSGPVRITMTTTGSSPDRTWRAFIKCYVVDP